MTVFRKHDKNYALLPFVASLLRACCSKVRFSIDNVIHVTYSTASEGES